jgi:hypothetical protein
LIKITGGFNNIFWGLTIGLHGTESLPNLGGNLSMLDDIGAEFQIVATSNWDSRGEVATNIIIIDCLEISESAVRRLMGN